MFTITRPCPTESFASRRTAGTGAQRPAPEPDGDADRVRPPATVLVRRLCWASLLERVFTVDVTRARAALDTIIAWTQLWGLKALLAALIFLVGRLAAKVAKKSLRVALRRSKVDETLIIFVSNLAYGLLLTVVVIASLGQLGIQTTSFIAILGAAGLAVGLALQGSLANFAAGMLMIIFRPFKVGDFIEAAGTMGTVEEIEIFTTKLRSPDNKEIVIPNNLITSANITNFSAKETRSGCAAAPRTLPRRGPPAHALWARVSALCRGRLSGVFAVRDPRLRRGPLRLPRLRASPPRAVFLQGPDMPVLPCPADERARRLSLR